MKDYPKVLIVAHNALSDLQSNGKTICGFFNKWNYDNLAQVYLTTDIPDFTITKKFFQLHDFDIAKRLFLNKKIQGRRITEADVLKLQTIKMEVVKSPFLKILRNNISPFVRLVRDIVWNLGGYKTHELKRFVDDFNPDIVFFQTSNATFAFSLVKWICKVKNIPLIIQTTDDYVTPKFSMDPFFWIQHFRILKVSKWAFLNSKCVIAIGDKMAAEYKRKFGGNYFVAMNSIKDLNLPIYDASKNSTIKLIFAGNLVLNRWKMLVTISKCLEELHIEEGILGELAVYSLLTPGNDELMQLENRPYSSYNGAIDTAGLNMVKSNSDILVHVEAFDNKNKHITRLSISTKIPEYLASGRCIFAIGPAEVASMEYLKEYDLGITVNSSAKCDVKAALKSIMLDGKKRIAYAEKGILVAKERHNASYTTDNIYNIVSDAVSETKVVK